MYTNVYHRNFYRAICHKNIAILRTYKFCVYSSLCFLGSKHRSRKLRREICRKDSRTCRRDIVVVADGTTNFRGYIREQHPWKWSRYWYRKTTCRGAASKISIKLKAAAGGKYVILRFRVTRDHISKHALAYGQCHRMGCINVIQN